MPQRKKPVVSKRVVTFRSDADRRRAFDVLLRKHGSAADLELRLAR